MTIKYSASKETYLNGGHQYHFTTKPCPGCKGTEEISVDAQDVFRYNQGAHVQVAFPYLTPDQRERLFISGYCGTCWDAMWKEEA